MMRTNHQWGEQKGKKSTSDCTKARETLHNGWSANGLPNPRGSLLLLGSSVAYAETSPSWWSDGLQSQTGLDLSVFLLLLSIFIIIANLFLILILFVSLRLNISMFDEHERKLFQQGMAMNNSHGYAEVRRIFDVTRRILRGG